jgi:hypothetical protein
MLKTASSFGRHPDDTGQYREHKSKNPEKPEGYIGIFYRNVMVFS